MIAEEDRKKLQTQLAGSNLILKKYYKQIASSKGRKGFATPDGERINRAKFYGKILALSKTNPDSDLNLYGITIPKNEVQNILSLEKIKLQVIDSIHNMILDLVNKKVKNKIKDRALSFDDLKSTALESVLRSMHSYCKEEICFSTYFYTCANREINNLCSRSNSLSKMSRKSVALKRKYIETRKSVSGPANFDEIVQLMSISKKDAELLRKTLSCNVSSEEDAVERRHGATFSKNYAGIDGSKKYFSSGHSKGFPLLSGSNNTSEETLRDLPVGDMDFSPLEKAVLEGFMQSSAKLGINSIAKDLINPKTGRPFSRMAITYAWRRIKKKINNFRKVA